METRQDRPPAFTGEQNRFDLASAAWLLAHRLAMNSAELTPETLRRAANIKEKIDGLQTELETILGIERFERLVSLRWIRTPKPVRKLHWTQTKAGRILRQAQGQSRKRSARCVGIMEN